MRKKALSICIPVYNRKHIFEVCLNQACEACEEFEDDVEIVISDNSSEEDLETIVNNVREKYPKIDMVFNRNIENIGLARNFLKVVELSSGEFCWIIGSDDFIKKEGVKEIISIFKNNSEIDFLVCNYDLLNLDEKRKMEMKKHLIAYTLI